jgi:hypothetical protein
VVFGTLAMLPTLVRATPSAHAAPHAQAARAAASLQAPQAPPPEARTDAAATDRELAQVRQQLARMADSAAAATRRLKEAQQRAVVQPDGAFTEAGVQVRYPTASVSEAELNRVRRAIRHARSTLEREYGDAGIALLDGDEWRVSTTATGTLRPSARITLGENATSTLTTFPFSVRNISAMALRRASVRALALHPAIATFAAGAPVLSDADEQYYTARRQLVAGRSGPARRCAAGNLAACDGLLGEDPTKWHDGDPPRGVYSRPVTRAVHGSLVAFAIERKGAVVLDALRAGGPADAEPIAVLARIAELPRDEFLAQWHARLLAESRRHAAPSFPLAATSLAWCGLLLVIVGRRRPR